jgi:uncharacterized protein (TIGR02001 family)
MKKSKPLVLAALLAGPALMSPAHADDLSANVNVTNNYIWRGLTQTENNPAVQGGIDWTSDSGFYAGTWVSNVSYAPAGVFNYENDLYAGFAGGSEKFSWDVGYLYYNYDSDAEFDFGEIYGSVSFAGLSLSANVLANTEADETRPGDDFGFGKAVYLAADYGFEILDGLILGLHLGWHDGDFVDAFNGVDGDYFDYNVSLSRGGFAFMVTSSNANGCFDDGENPEFCSADIASLDNDAPKFVVSYTVDFDLLSQ